MSIASRCCDYADQKHFIGICKRRHIKATYIDNDGMTGHRWLFIGPTKAVKQFVVEKYCHGPKCPSSFDKIVSNPNHHVIIGYKANRKYNSPIKSMIAGIITNFKLERDECRRLHRRIPYEELGIKLGNLFHNRQWHAAKYILTKI